MSKFKDASDNIKRLQVMFKGLTDLADAMDSIDSLENHIAELQSKKVKVINENIILDKSNQDLKILNKDLANISVELKAQGEKIKADNSKALVDQIKIFESECANRKAEKHKEYEKFQASFESKINDKQNQLQNLNVEIELKSKKLEEINAALEKIKGGI